MAEDLFADVRSGTPKIVEVGSGHLRGYITGGVTTFLGIPFAAPPIGPRRWMPPAPPADWSGVRDAGAFGGFCAQTSLYGVFGKRSLNEDCLYLNVFAPAEPVDKPRPVMIWIHGGGLINGRSDDYDARKLVIDGNVVVVTINYRISVFGFLSHPSLDQEGHPFSNYGILDQQAAMRWVKSNIARFGGDPNNVTLFGESAGGSSTLVNMGSPSAAGLFHKVIVLSGVPRLPQVSVEEGEKFGLEFAAALGCDDETTAASRMRSKTVEEIVEKAEGFLGRSSRVFDGQIVPAPTPQLFAEGKFHKVPALIGNTFNEFTWFMSFAEIATGKPLSREDYLPRLASVFGGMERAQRVLAEYPFENFDTPSEAISEAHTAWFIICPSRQIMRSLAAHVPTYVYEFMDVTAPQYFEPVSFPYGAAHTLELQYLFPRFHGGMGTPKPLNAAQGRLSDAMVKYFANFAHNGDPNGFDLPDWPKWTPEVERTQLLDLKISTSRDSGINRKCEFWDAL